MAGRRRTRKPVGDGIVKVGDVIELADGGNGLAVLPDDTVVTVRQSYRIQHEGLHVIGGVEYLAEKD